MKKINLFLTCLFIVAIAFGQQKNLKLTLKQGESYTQISDANISIQQSLMGQTMDIKMNVISDLTFKVRGNSGDVYDMDTKYRGLKMVMDMPQGKMEYSSDVTGGGDAFSQVLSKLVDEPFTIKINEKGYVTEVTDVDGLFESAFSDFQNLPAAQADQIRSQLEQSYGGESLKGSIELVTAIFPDKDVAVGEEWTSSTTLNNGMEIEVNSTYKLAEYNDSYFVITGTSQMKTPEDAEPMMTNGMPMKFNLQGTMTSNIKLDSKTGWILESSYDQTIKGDAVLESNSQMPSGMTIPMTITSKTSVKAD